MKTAPPAACYPFRGHLVRFIKVQTEYTEQRPEEARGEDIAICFSPRMRVIAAHIERIFRNSKKSFVLPVIQIPNDSAHCTGKLM